MIVRHLTEIDVICAGSSAHKINAASAIVPVIEGDYFTLNVYQDSGVSVDTRTVFTWLSIEVIE